MERIRSHTAAVVSALTALSRATADSPLGRRVLLISGALLVLNAGVFLLLQALFGVDLLFEKTAEYLVHKLSRITTQGPLLSAVVLCLLLEVAVVGYDRSTLFRLLHPSGSAKTDIYLLLLHLTGVFAILEAVMTLGASEWLPMLARRAFAADALGFIDNPWAKFALIYLCLDCLRYWVHRLSHTWGWAWEAHRFHHAATEMNMITSFRRHPLDILIDLLIAAIPAAMLGSSGVAPFAAFATLTIAHDLLIHSNFGWSWGWLGKYVIASPAYHRIHHSSHEDHIDSNFCNSIIIWDWMFGTRYDGSVQPTELGFENNPYNKHGFARDLIDCTSNFFGTLCTAIFRGLRSLWRRSSA